MILVSGLWCSEINKKYYKPTLSLKMKKQKLASRQINKAVNHPLCPQLLDEILAKELNLIENILKLFRLMQLQLYIT